MNLVKGVLGISLCCAIVFLFGLHGLADEVPEPAPGELRTVAVGEGPAVEHH